jgi:translation initiation factor 2 alpha subunit (eIF-2alpha)
MDHLRPLLSTNGLDSLPERVIRKLSNAHREALRTAIEKIIEEYGSLDEFFRKEMEVTDNLISAIKKNLLESPSSLTQE